MWCHGQNIEIYTVHQCFLRFPSLMCIYLCVYTLNSKPFCQCRFLCLSWQSRHSSLKIHSRQYGWTVTRHVFQICSLYSDKHSLYYQANIKDNRNLPKWWTVVLGDMLLQGSSGELSLARTLQKLAGSTHIHHEILQLWQAGGMTLMEVP